MRYASKSRRADPKCGQKERQHAPVPPLRVPPDPVRRERPGLYDAFRSSRQCHPAHPTGSPPTTPTTLHNESHHTNKPFVTYLQTGLAGSAALVLTVGLNSLLLTLSLMAPDGPNRRSQFGGLGRMPSCISNKDVRILHSEKGVGGLGRRLYVRTIVDTRYGFWLFRASVV